MNEILWIGGPAAAGKTTVSRLLARRHGLLWYSVDAHTFAHEQRAAAAGIHDPNSGPGTFDRRPMIVDDIQSLAVDAAVVIEGAFVTPQMAGTFGNAVWLMPSRTEQLARLEHRNPGGRHDGAVWGWELIHSQLDGSAATVITVDGQTIEQTITAVEHHFRTPLASCPAARTTAERQALLRIGNHQLAAQAAQQPRPGQTSPTTLTFDCECGQPQCTEAVDLPTTHLTQPPAPVLAPTHPT